MVGLSTWQDKIVQWAMNPTEIESPDITQTKDLMILAMRRHIETIYFGFDFHKYQEHIEMDDWEAYAIDKRGGGTWIQLRVRFHQNLVMWCDICRLLDVQELETLDAWGRERISLKHHYFSLLDLRRDLIEEGLI